MIEKLRARLKKAAVPTLDELYVLRERYHDCVRQRAIQLKVEFRDKAISAQAAHFIIQQLKDRRVCSVLDMGIGFSTVSIGFWCAKYQLAYRGVDHDAAWMRFVTNQVFKRVVPPAHPMDLTGTGDLMKNTADLRDSFDAVIVDHGPTAQKRVDDIPWLTTLLAPDGVMFFDDWRAHYGRKIAGKLPASKWQIEVAESTKRFECDKAIAYAVRRAP